MNKLEALQVISDLIITLLKMSFERKECINNISRTYNSDHNLTSSRKDLTFIYQNGQSHCWIPIGRNINYHYKIVYSDCQDYFVMKYPDRSEVLILEAVDYITHNVWYDDHEWLIEYLNTLIIKNI